MFTKKEKQLYKEEMKFKTLGIIVSILGVISMLCWITQVIL